MKKQTLFGLTLFIIFILASVQAFAAVTFGAITETDPAEAGIYDVTLSAEITSDGTITGVTLFVDGIDYSSSLTTASPYTITLPASLFTSTGVHGILGEHSYTFTATDDLVDSQEFTDSFTTQDTTGPSITILDVNPATVEVGTTYIDAGATATDVYEGYLTSLITLTSTVNENVVGTYEVTYTVTDSAGNSAQSIRAVNVVDSTLPVITITSASATVEYGNTQLILATVTDNYDLVETSVTLFLSDGSEYPMTQTGTDEYTAFIDTIGLSLTTYTYTITASDSTGNIGTTSGTDFFDVVDTTVPIFGETSVGNDIVTCYEDPLVVSATVTDNYDTIIPYVAIYIDGAPGDGTNGAGYYQLTQSATDSTLYEITFDTTVTDFSGLGDYTGDYLYNFYALDGSTNSATTTVESFSIADCTGPEITNVVESSDPVIYGNDITINATITEQTGIATDFDIQYITVYDSAGAVVYSADLGFGAGPDEYTVTFNTAANLGSIGVFDYTITATNDDGYSTEVTGSFEVLDRTAATISAVTVDPASPIAYGVDVTITATITDDVSDTVTATLYIFDSSGAAIIAEAMDVSGTTYSKTLLTSSIGLGTFTFKIIAEDEQGNIAATDGTDSFSITDQYAPSLDVTESADPVNYGDDITITATVVDDVAVDPSTVLITVDGFGTYTMSATGNPDEYAITFNSVTDLAGLGTYTYLITASDSSGNPSDEAVGSFEVRDLTTPSINSHSVSPSRVNQNDPVTFTADVTDNIAVSSVSVTVDGISYPMSNTAGSTYEFILDTTGMALGTYTYTITATDAEGNSATASGTFTITIVSPITVDILADKISGEEDLDVSFRSNVVGGVVPLRYAWNFGDGDTSVSQNVRHVFHSDGVYTVTLTVSDNYGNVGTDAIVITVGAEEPTTNPRNNIRLDEISFGNDVVEAGELLETFVTIENVGEDRLKDVSVTIYIEELGIWARSTQDDVRRGDDEDMVVALEIPEDAEPGIYDVRIVISNDDMKRVKHRDVEII